MYLAIKEIKKEKLRFLMIVLAIALIAYLVYFLASLAFGLAQLNRTAVDHWGATGVIVSKSANKNIYASSIDSKVKDGINDDNLEGINVINTTVYVVNQDETSEDPENLVFIGYNLEKTHILPEIVEGRNIENSEEVTVSVNFKEKYPVELNDEIKIAKTGRQFRVVGFTIDSNYNTVPVGYITQEMATQEMMLYSSQTDSDLNSMPTSQIPNRISALVIYDELPNIDLEKNGLEYIPINDFINSIPGYQAQVLTFGFMIISLTLIASVIIGIFMYILTMQKKSIFGVLKIQGYQNKYIARSVLYQSIILIVIGFAVGLGLTVLTVSFLPAAVPVQLFWPLNIAATISALVCSLIGTVFSARNILKIDPLDAL